MAPNLLFIVDVAFPNGETLAAFRSMEEQTEGHTRDLDRFAGDDRYMKDHASTRSSKLLRANEWCG